MKPFLISALFVLFMAACNNERMNHENNEKPIKGTHSVVRESFVKSRSEKDSANSFSSESPKPESPISVNVRIPQVRITEGINDSKLNGEPIHIQQDLQKTAITDHPDTITKILKSYYNNNERQFPRSIEDNFEAGISTERVSYPKLNFVIELFENEYAKNPYKTIRHSVRKVNKEIVVE